MPSVLISLLGLVSSLTTILTQSVDLEVTLTSHDITSISLSSLFQAPSSTANNMLSQSAVTVYNTSHPASIISKLGEQSVITNPIIFGANSLDYWFYNAASTDINALSNGVLNIIDYKSAGMTRNTNLLLSIPIEPGNNCTGLDFSYLVTIVGCLTKNGSGFILYSIQNNVTIVSATFSFTQGYNIVGRLRLDLSSDSRYLTVFDDWTISNGAQGVYIFAVTQTYNFTQWNIISTVGNSNINAVTDASIDVSQEGAPTLTISMIDSVSKFVEINICTITFDTNTLIASLSNCNEVGVSALGITAGRAKILTGTSSTFVIAFNNSSPQMSYSNVLYCTQPSGSVMYSLCQSTIRGLPFWNGTNITALSITNYGQNTAINFKNTYTRQVWTILDIQPYQATSTMAVSFDSIIEPTQLGSFVVAPMDAYVNLPILAKFYGDMGPSNYTLQITAMDMPYPSNSSTVALRRALIQVTQTLPMQNSTAVWVRVVVLNNMTGLMGFTDQLPDFGALTSGYAMANMDRSWLYGNNLQLSLTGTALNKTTVFDRMSYSFSLSNGAVLNQMFVRGENELVGSDMTNIYYYICAPGQTNNSMCTVQLTIPLAANYNLYKVYDTVSFPDIPQAQGCVLILRSLTGSILISYINRQTPNLQPVTVSFPDQLTYRDIHMINYLGTLMFFGAPNTTLQSNSILVYTTSDPISQSSAFAFLGNITAAMYGIPGDQIVPDKIKSCGHNDNVVEWLTGDGYIAKTWVSGITQEGLGARPLVRIVNNNLPSFIATDFCPMGDEFIVWDNAGHIFSTSTQADNTFYSLGLSEFGFQSVTGATCARLSASVGVWGQDASGNTLVATLFGNQFNTAQSKIHSVIRWPNNNVPNFARTFEFTPSGIVHVTINNGVPTCMHMILAGPYLLTGFFIFLY